MSCAAIGCLSCSSADVYLDGLQVGSVSGRGGKVSKGSIVLYEVPYRCANHEYSLVAPFFLLHYEIVDIIQVKYFYNYLKW